MWVRRGALGAAVAAACVAIAFAGPVWAAEGTSEEIQVRLDPDTLERVTDHLDHHRAELGIPGLAVGIVHRDEVVLLDGLGRTRLSDGEPIGPDTPFHLASVAKSLTATAVVQLVERGEVDGAAPVTTYLPELGSGGDEVTIRDLLHHRSGLSTYQGQVSTFTAVGESLDETVLRLGPHLRAGAGFAYSNANYDVLALVVERVTGLEFGEYLREHVFAPLEMDATFVEPRRAEAAGLAQGHYHWLFLGYRPHDAPMPPGMVGSATMFSSAEDLTHLLVALHNGGTYRGELVVSEASVRAMRDAVPLEPGLDGGTGLGWDILPAFRSWPELADAELTVVLKGGSWPTSRGLLATMPDLDLGIVLLANGNDVTDDTWLRQLSRDVFALLLGLEPPGVSPGSPALERWSKHLLLVGVVGQLVLAIAAVPVLSRVRRGLRLRARGRAILAAATLLDLSLASAVVWLSRSVFQAPLRGGFVLPDYRLLLGAMVLGLVWGLVRTAVIGVTMLRRAGVTTAQAG